MFRLVSMDPSSGWAFKKASCLLLLPLALQPIVGFGLSNNVPPFCPICHQFSPSSHFLHLKISFYFFSPSFPGPSSSSRPFQFLREDLFGHPILLHSLRVTQPTYPLPLYPFYYIFSFIHKKRFCIQLTVFLLSVVYNTFLKLSLNMSP